MRRLSLLPALLAAPLLAQEPVDFAKPVDFSKEVRPILSDHCYACHGPDEATRKAQLRLDTPEGAAAVIAATATTPSELVARISAHDAGERMPPAGFPKPLTPAKIETLVRWISEGAKWEAHWSFVTPERPEVPDAGEGWALTAIDRFLAARLAAEDLTPNPAADRETLLRRISYDLTGLPPTQPELDAFLADTEPGAYERQVDRLLASPRFGERMASGWLDLARYADTHGLHLDNERIMWRYRDWVVDAFNAGKPFDEFTIEQLAGDLLDNPTNEQLIGSGFNRCNPTSAEGGMIAEEYLTLYARDRVDTTATAWMGLTLACAKCHDHKYDPFSTREYYEMYAFFNSLTEEATDRNIRNPVPFLRTADAVQQAKIDGFDARIADLNERVDAPMPEVDAGQVVWEAEWSERLGERWRIVVPVNATSSGGSTLTPQPDDSVLASGANPAKDVYEIEAFAGETTITALRLEALVGGGNSDNVPGRAPNQNFVLTGFEVEAYPAGKPEEARPVPFYRADASHSQDQYPIAATLDGNPETGWGGLEHSGNRSAVFVPLEPFGFEGGTALRIRMKHESRFTQHTIGRFRLAITSDPAMAPSTLGTWSKLGIFDTPDPRAALREDFGPEAHLDLAAACGPKEHRWQEAPELTDGQAHLFAPQPGILYFHRVIDAPSARTLSIGLGSDDGIRAWVNGRLIHDNPVARGVAVDQDLLEVPLTSGRNDLLVKVANYGGGFGFAFTRQSEDSGLPVDLALLLAEAPDAREAKAASKLRRHYRSRHAPRWVALIDERDALQTERTAFENGLPTTLISREMETPRPAYLLVRGAYDVRGDEVQRALPAALPALPEGQPLDRLGFARWLVSGEHPLTARVTVNRLWQQFYGVGIVKTTEDFGSQGEYPVHPELLDWLAVEFVESGWDQKALVRKFVTSAAYRQSSRVTAELYERDPDNRLLARGPRFRLSGEEIRDTALYLSGLLIETMGGPSVRPYQPDGVWFAVGYSGSNTVRYSQDQGEALWRRSLYTFWKRTAPPPNMVSFDAPSREACTVQRTRTITPQQALVLWNDPTYVEAARHLAARVLREGGDDDVARVRWAYRTVVGKTPTAIQERALVRGLDAQRTLAAEEAAAKLLEVGDTPRIDGLDPVEHTAWTNLATALFSLPQAITRG